MTKVAGDLLDHGHREQSESGEHAGAESPGRMSRSARGRTTSPRSRIRGTRPGTRPAALAPSPSASRRPARSNDDKAASLTVVKRVINDDGGTKTAAQFPISVTGNASIRRASGRRAPGDAGRIGPGRTTSPRSRIRGTRPRTRPAARAPSPSASRRPARSPTTTRPRSLTVIKDVVNDSGVTRSPATSRSRGSAPRSGELPGRGGSGHERRHRTRGVRRHRGRGSGGTRPRTRPAARAPSPSASRRPARLRTTTRLRHSRSSKRSSTTTAARLFRATGPER